jgi:ABC-type antimicrobial peptide transport system permease subunit
LRGSASAAPLARLRERRRSLLYGVKPFDPFTLVATVLMLFACASVALLGPVRRATKVDPISVMR